MKTPAFTFFAITLACGCLCAAAEPVDFAHDVLPILKTHCAKCHTNGTYKGGMSLDSREALLDSGTVEPRNSAGSSLIERVTSTVEEDRMPAEAPPLSEAQIDILRTWVDQGLTWQEGFSFKATSYIATLKPRRVELPAATEGRTNPVDRIVDAYLAEKTFSQPATIDDATFMRRLYLDVIGLLPSPERVDAFLSRPDPNKRQTLIDEVLNDDRAYAEHWLTFWNDMLRNDYQGTGFIDGGRKQITPWLYKSLVDNKPYDQFVRELISPTSESEGFIRGIRWRGRVNASQRREVQFAQNVAQVFLGLNLKCASCHDSFINDWKLADSYGLAAIISEEPLEVHRCDKPTGVTAKAKFLFPELGTIDADQPRDQRLKQFALLITSKENGRLTRTVVNRIWHRLMGRGIVQPVDVMDGEPWNADLLDYLAVDLADHGYDLKRTIRRICNSQAYQSQCSVSSEKDLRDDYVYRGPVARRLTAEQFIDAIWTLTATAPDLPATKLELPDSKHTTHIRASLVTGGQLMRSLGRPNREQVVTVRPEKMTTLLALDLSNGDLMAGLLKMGADNLLQQHSDWTPEQFVDWIYRSTLSRPPSDHERVRATELVGSPKTPESVADLLWIVLMLPEFQVIQ